MWGALVVVGCARGGLAAGEALATAPATAPAPATARVDGLAPLVPIRPRTVADDRRLEAYALFCQARYEELHNRWPQALRTYTRALELAPDSPEVLRSLVPLYVNLGRIDDAIQSLRRLVELRPADPEAWQKLGELLLRQRKPQQAVEALQRALAQPELNRHSAGYIFLMHDLFMLYLQLQQFDKAAEASGPLLEAMDNPGAFGLSREEYTGLFGPNLVQRYEQLAWLHVQVKQFDRAVALFRKAYEVSGQKTALDMRLAEVYLAQGRLDLALTHCRQHLAQPRADDSVSQEPGYRLLVEILDRAGRAAEIVPELEAAARKRPHDLPIHYLLAEKYYAAGRVDQALKLYLELIDKDGRPPGSAYQALVKIYRDRNQFDELLVAIGQAYDLPGNRRRAEDQVEEMAKDKALAANLAQAAVQLAQNRPKAVTFGTALCAGYLAAAAKDWPVAERFYRQAIQLKPKDPFAYHHLASMHWGNKAYGRAAAVFQEAIDADAGGEEVDFHRVLARMLALDGQTERALEAIQVSIARHPRDPEPRSTLAWILADAGRTEQAMAEYQRLIADFPMGETARLARLRLASLLVDINRFDEAETHYLAVLKEAPDDPSVNNDLGYFWADRGLHLDKAEAMIRKALKEEPDNAAFLDSLGWVLFKKHQFQEAKVLLEKASQQEDYQDPVIWDHLGDVYFRLDALEAARKAWEQALKLYAEEQRRRKDRKPEARQERIQEKLRSLPTQRKGVRTDRSNP